MSNDNLLNSSRSKRKITYKVWWFCVAISIFLAIAGNWNYYTTADLDKQYVKLQSQMTSAQQIYSEISLSQFHMATYLFFGACIIMIIMGIVAFFWFDDKRLF